MTRIRTDVFPATVTVTSPDGDAAPRTFEKARLVMTMDTAYVFQDSPTGPALVYKERLASYDPGVPLHRRTRSVPERSPQAVTDSGASLTFRRASGCGCGSRLKSFDPFSVINLVASTKDR